ncbi:MAG: peptidoglycan-binding domain-containing protein [Merdibacter sp.]
MSTSLVLQPGRIGISVNKMQGYLNLMRQRGMIQTALVEDGVYGANMSRASAGQTYLGLPVDGIIGEHTWDGIMEEIRKMNIVTNIPVAVRGYALRSGEISLGVYMMQKYLSEIAQFNDCLRPIPIDGNYGTRTVKAVEQFQYLYDLAIDGTIGTLTWDAIVNERNALLSQ